MLRGDAEVRPVQRLQRARWLASMLAIVGAGAAIVWFAVAAAAGSGIQMTAASALFAAIASGWSAAFAAITARLTAARAG